MADRNLPLKPTLANRHRFLFLDALRGLAAALVVVHHAPAFLGRLLPGYHAFLAVDLFFVLSGFVIGFSYEHRLETKLRFSDFVAARLIRLYPVYFIGSLLGAVLQIVVGHDTSSMSWHVVLFGVLLLPDLLSVSRALFPLDGPAWSLFLEIVANVIYAGLVCRRRANNAVLYVIAVISFAFLCWWMIHISHTANVGGARNGPDGIAGGLARIGFSFFAGVLAFRLYRRGWGKSHIEQLGLFAPAGVVVAIVLALATNLTQSIFSQLLAIGVLFPGLVYIGACVHLPPKWTGVCAFLGEASYPLYLIHIPFFSVLYSRTFKHLISGYALAGPVAVVGSVAGLLVISSWLGRHVDAPARSFLTHKYKGWAASRRTS